MVDPICVNFNFVLDLVLVLDSSLFDYEDEDEEDSVAASRHGAIRRCNSGLVQIRARGTASGRFWDGGRVERDQRRYRTFELATGWRR